MRKYIDKNTGEPPDFESDRRLCLCLEPDQWERDEQVILNKQTLRIKINPMLGLIVQHSSYDAWISEAQSDITKIQELKAKLFNVYQIGRVELWMKPDRIRRLQVPKRVTDCTYAKGWQTFVGLDFSHGDDLFAITYLSVNYIPGGTMAGRFFADMDAWVLESTMKESPNRPLYEIWEQQGWLHVCPGETFDSTYAMNALAERVKQGINMVMFGYDPAQSKWPLNTLKAWLYTLGVETTTIEQMIVPVAQTTLAQTPRISELETMIFDADPWINFSENPMWPWQFGNTGVELTSSNLRRICKGGPQKTHKMDNIAALVDALYCFDLSEGKIEK